jgi:hypothetical protein
MVPQALSAPDITYVHNLQEQLGLCEPPGSADQHWVTQCASTALPTVLMINAHEFGHPGTRTAMLVQQQSLTASVIIIIIIISGPTLVKW